MTNSKNTYPIEITFASPGACPPIYVAGSFTEPPWEPRELQCSIGDQQDAVSDSQKKYVFHRTFDLPKGNYQYKFRLGHDGNWWVCDHTVATATDALGNRNNHLVVAESASVTFEANEPSTSLSSDSKVAEENGKYPTDNPILSHSKQSSQQFESVISTAVSPFETCTSTAQIACPDLKQALKPSSLVMQENLDHSLRSREDGTSSAAATPSVEAKPSPPVPGGFLHQIFHWLPSFLFVFFRKRI